MLLFSHPHSLWHHMLHLHLKCRKWQYRPLPVAFHNAPASGVPSVAKHSHAEPHAPSAASHVIRCTCISSAISGITCLFRATGTIGGITRCTRIRTAVVGTTGSCRATCTIRCIIRCTVSEVPSLAQPAPAKPHASPVASHIKLLLEPRLQLMRERMVPQLLLDPGVLTVRAQAAGAGADGTATRAAVRLGLKCC
jgi:hypothetical protein